MNTDANTVPQTTDQKVAIVLPWEIYAELESLRREFQIKRSWLYAEALKLGAAELRKVGQLNIQRSLSSPALSTKD